MKKITLLFAFLLTAAFAVAQTYTINVGASTGKFYRNNGDEATSSQWACKYVSTIAGYPVVTISTTAGHKFASERNAISSTPGGTVHWTISVEDGYTITGWKFVGYAQTSSATITPEGGEAVTFTTTSATVGAEGLSTQETSFDMASSSDMRVIFTSYQVYVKGDGETKNVVYNLYYDGMKMSTSSVEALVGSSAEANIPTEMNADYVTLATDVATIDETTSEVNVTATWNGPFEIASDVAAAHYYYLTISGTNYPIYVADGADNVQDPATASESDEAKWAFVGNPYDGFYIYNKAAGAGVVLGSATADPSSDAGRNQHTSMQTPGTQDEEIWQVQRVSDTGFYLANSQGYCLNRRSNSAAYLAYWTGGKGENSVFTVRDAENFYNEVQANIKPFYDAPSNNPFYLSEAGAAQMDAIMSAVESSGFCTLADYNTLLDILSNNTVKIETGYYRLRSVGARAGTTYVAYGTTTPPTGTFTGLITVPADEKDADVGTILLLTKQDDGTYTISVQGLNVQNQTTNNRPFPATNEEGAKFTFIGVAPGQAAISSDLDSQGFFHEATWKSENGVPAGVIRWTQAATASHWYVEPAETLTLTLNAAGDNSYATTYLPFDVTLGGDAEAYVVQVSGDGDKAELVSIGQDVPAGTPVLVVSETQAATAEAAITAGLTATTEANDLVGSYVSAQPANALVLNAVDGKPGFYPLASGSTLAANRAYLDGTVAVRSLLFPGELTGIRGLTETGQTPAGTAFDLQGRRVARPHHGVYIVGGKKVVIK